MNCLLQQKEWKVVIFFVSRLPLYHARHTRGCTRSSVLQGRHSFEHYNTHMKFAYDG